MSDAKEHMGSFRVAAEMLDTLVTRVRKSIGDEGCEAGLKTLKQGAYFLGTMDAHYDAAPKGHPVRKTFFAQMKKGQTELKRAKKLFEKRCERPRRRR